MLIEGRSVEDMSVDELICVFCDTNLAKSDGSCPVCKAPVQHKINKMETIDIFKTTGYKKYAVYDALKRFKEI